MSSDGSTKKNIHKGENEEWESQLLMQMVSQ